jgi:predicted ATP-grasp superfamily ATP-dependent carboligase
MTSRTWRAATVAAAAGLVLAGCDSGLFSGPLAIRMDATELEIATCRPAAITSLLVQERGTGIFRQWTDVLIGSGSATVARGTTFSENDPLPGLIVERLTDLELREGHEVAVTLRGEAGGAQLDAVFVIGKDGVPADGWLQPDGSVTVEPCPADS